MLRFVPYTSAVVYSLFDFGFEFAEICNTKFKPCGQPCGESPTPDIVNKGSSELYKKVSEFSLFFPARESLVSDIPAADGRENRKPFLQCETEYIRLPVSFGLFI
jgi:hypothetical protein